MPSAFAVFDHAFADHLVDRGFGEGGGDGLTGAAAFPVVGDAPGVGGQVVPSGLFLTYHRTAIK